MNHFTVDQAGKIEETSHDTVLAIHSKDKQYTIKIPRKLKRSLFNRCKKSFKKQMTLRTFAYCLFLLLKDSIQRESIVIIDDEYPTHGKNIKQFILQHIDINKEQIGFALIGKNDPAHFLANKTFCAKIKPNMVITEKQLSLEKFIPDKKLRKMLK